MKNKFQRGFTITELILYTAILITLITVLTSVFSSILDVQLESQSASSVDLDGRYILAKLIYDIHSMKTASPTNDTLITPASPGLSGSNLTFTIDSVNHTYSQSFGNLQLINNQGTNNLNSVNTTISALQFTRIGSGTNTDTIRLSFTVTSKISRNAGPESRTYQTTISSQ